MTDIQCPDCKMLWRNYADATTKVVSLESQQHKAAASGYLNLFKDLTDQLRRAELHRDNCRIQITEHESDQHAMKTAAASVA